MLNNSDIEIGDAACPDVCCRDALHASPCAVTEEDDGCSEGDAHVSLESAMRDRAHAFMRCCLYLRHIKREGYYKSVADSWAEYVASIGLTMDKSSRMVKCAAVMEALSNQDRIVPAMDTIDEDRLLRDWMPLVKYDKEAESVENPDSAIELLEQAKALSHSDFQAVRDQHKQATRHPEVTPSLNEGPVLDENKNVIGNYRTTKATGKQHFFTIGILDYYIRASEGNEIKVSLGK